VLDKTKIIKHLNHPADDVNIQHLSNALRCGIETAAKRVKKVLPKRFGRYGLARHPEKTIVLQQPTSYSYPMLPTAQSQKPPHAAMLLYLIRHGESVFNAEGRIQGHSDVPLSELGRRQGQAVADALAGRPIDALYSSPLPRAYQTAEILAARLNLPILTDDRLKEVNVGVFQGQLRWELNQKYPEEMARWVSEDLDYALPQGETRRQLIERGRAALQEIVVQKHRQVAVVSHGRLLMMTLKSLLALPLKQPPFSLQNGSITTIKYHAAGRFELAAMDQVEHLRNVGLSGSGDL
jgi:2,3-bisphosphoglycerate-dependent phosphoglycerate mutase